MSRFWNENTKQLEPYVAGQQPREGQKVIKLNTNENPYPPSPRIKDYLSSLDPTALRLYPDANCSALRDAFSEDLGVPKARIFCGNGSDEVLGFAFQAFFETGEGALPLLLPDITYSFYPVYSKLYGIPVQTLPVGPDFSVSAEAFCMPSGGVAIAQPNAPTGMALSLEDVEKIVAYDPNRVVIIDEAYIVFGGQTAVALTNTYPNVLIAGTLSKSHSLAGLRLGYAVGSEELIEGLCRVRDSFNSYPVDMLAQKIAEIAVRDKNWMRANTEKIIATRERMKKALEEMNFEVLPSATNFIFVRPLQIQAETIYNKLKNRGILIRYFNKPRINEYLRISVGTDEQVDEVLAQIAEIAQSGKEQS